MYIQTMFTEYKITKKFAAEAAAIIGRDPVWLLNVLKRKTDLPKNVLTTTIDELGTIAGLGNFSRAFITNEQAATATHQLLAWLRFNGISITQLSVALECSRNALYKAFQDSKLSVSMLGKLEEFLTNIPKLQCSTQGFRLLRSMKNTTPQGRAHTSASRRLNRTTLSDYFDDVIPWCEVRHAAGKADTSMHQYRSGAVALVGKSAARARAMVEQLNPDCLEEFDRLLVIRDRGHTSRRVSEMSVLTRELSTLDDEEFERVLAKCLASFS